ncbi:MAG: dihydrodipicolinate synthase family protein [Pirellulales bacterium]|nr:dihydrodipicolinate synthase family protein [Pirellulales bacterium]
MASEDTLPQPLQGIIPPMVTPLSDRDTLDVDGLQRLVEHILSGGVHGLFVLSTTGEAPSLSYRLRFELIDHVCKQVAGRVPILVGVTDTSFYESVNLANYAADAGAQAVVLSAPYYYPAGQAELLQYIEHMVAALPLPVFLYNLPSHTKLTFEPDTLRRLIDIQKVVGLKDSSGDMIYFHKVRRLARERPDWSLLIGPEELLAEAVLLGGHGGVCGGANLSPKLYVGLYEAAVHHEMERVAELHDRVLQICDSIYTVARHGAPVVKGLKSSLACLKICGDFLAEPFYHFGDAERQLVRERLAELQFPLGLPRHTRPV